MSWICSSAFLFEWWIYTVATQININFLPIFLSFRKSRFAYFYSLFVTDLSWHYKWRFGWIIILPTLLSKCILLLFYWVRLDSSSFFCIFSFRSSLSCFIIIIIQRSMRLIVWERNTCLRMRIKNSISLSLFSPEEVVVILCLKPIRTRCKWIKSIIYVSVDL